MSSGGRAGKREARGPRHGEGREPHCPAPRPGDFTQRDFAPRALRPGPYLLAASLLFAFPAGESRAAAWEPSARRWVRGEPGASGAQPGDRGHPAAVGRPRDPAARPPAPRGAGARPVPGMLWPRSRPAALGVCLFAVPPSSAATVTGSLEAGGREGRPAGDVPAKSIPLSPRRAQLRVPTAGGQEERAAFVLPLPRRHAAGTRGGHGHAVGRFGGMLLGRTGAEGTGHFLGGSPRNPNTAAPEPPGGVSRPRPRSR